MQSRPPKLALAILISILVLLVFFGLYVGVDQLITNYGRTNYVEIPLIKTSMNSSSDGEPHTLEAKFYLDVTKFKNRDVDRNALYDKIKDVVSNLDYDRLAAEDGTKYIKNEVANSLSEFVEPEDLKGVYLSDIISDIELTPDELPDNRRDEVFKGLFKNIK